MSFVSPITNSNQTYVGQHLTDAPYYNTFTQTGSQYQAIVKGRCTGSSVTSVMSFGNLHNSNGTQDFVFHRINSDGTNSVQYILSGTTGGTIWHSGNDGAGSGLDADLLDGINGADFVRTSTDQSISGTKTFTGAALASGSSGGMAVNTAGDSRLEVRSSGVANAAYMTFHMPGQYACRLGLDNDNVFKVGGWSFGNAAYPVLLGSFTNSTNYLTLRGSSPTLVLRDTDQATGYIHVNGNLLYVLRAGAEADFGQWTPINSRWPFILNLLDNNATFGGGVYMDQNFLQISGTRFRVDATANGVQSSNIYNNGTTAGANVTVRANDFLMERNVSSIKYKHSVEDLDDDISDRVIRNLRPVWYRSKCANDTPDWSWYGFIAEEVAEVEPRLCHWDAPLVEEETDEYEQPEPYTNAKGELITPDPVRIVRKYQDPNAPKEVEGVMYERFTVLLVDQVQKLIKRIESIEKKLESI